jgi:AcrR family transcriptional regulator
MSETGKSRSAPVRRRTPEEIISTAEWLIAARGIDGVSMREIAAAAGHRNHAVVQYHFGSKTQLVQAIIEHRLPDINTRRLELLDELHRQGRSSDLRGLAEAMARPLLELGPETRYVEFLARLRDSGELRDAYFSTGDHSRSVELLHERLDDVLGALPPAVRQHRVRMTSDLMLTSIAHRHVEVAVGGPVSLSNEEFATDLYTAMAAVLSAPARATASSFQAPR